MRGEDDGAERAHGGESVEGRAYSIHTILQVYNRVHYYYTTVLGTASIRPEKKVGSVGVSILMPTYLMLFTFVCGHQNSKHYCMRPMNF